MKRLEGRLLITEQRLSDLKYRSEETQQIWRKNESYKRENIQREECERLVLEFHKGKVELSRTVDLSNGNVTKVISSRGWV